MDFYTLTFDRVVLYILSTYVSDVYRLLETFGLTDLLVELPVVEPCFGTCRDVDFSLDATGAIQFRTKAGMRKLQRILDERDMLARMTDDPDDFPAEDDDGDKLSPHEIECAEEITQLPEGTYVGHPLTFSMFWVRTEEKTLLQTNGSDLDAENMKRWMHHVGWQVSDGRWEVPNKCKSTQGRILVSSPVDPPRQFIETVVVILLHSNKGASGLVLNRPTTQASNDFLSDCTAARPLNISLVDRSMDAFVQNGGKVVGPVLVLHDCEEAGELAVGSGVWLSTTPVAVELAMRRANRLRIYDRHLAWFSGWLDNEVARRRWYVVGDLTAADVFHDQFDGPTQWRVALHRYGRKVYDGMGIVPAGVG